MTCTLYDKGKKTRTDSEIKGQTGYWITLFWVNPDETREGVWKMVMRERLYITKLSFFFLKHFALFNAFSMHTVHLHRDRVQQSGIRVKPTHTPPYRTLLKHKFSQNTLLTEKVSIFITNLIEFYNMWSCHLAVFSPESSDALLLTAGTNGFCWEK